MAQFAKYGPNAEKIHKGRIMEQIKEQERSRSPRPRHRDDYRHKDYRRRSCSRSRDRSSRDRYRERDRDYRRRSRSYSRSPTYCKDDRRGRYDDERRSRSRSPCGRLTATLMVSWTPTPMGEKAHAIWLYIVPRAADIALLAVLVLILFRVGSRVACSSFWFSALQESRD